MHIGIYTPYLDSFGGGERYILTMAEVLSQHKNEDQVDLLINEHLFSLDPKQLMDKSQQRFNLHLDKVNLVKAPIGKNSNFLDRTNFLRKYDLIIFLTDGSIFYSTAKRSFLHIQSPLVGQPAKSLWGKIKLTSWNLIIYNSQFTKKWAEEKWPLTGQVIYPPVDIDSIKPLEKKKYIISVGRFFGYLKDKNHSLMIQVFKKLVDTNKISGWSLHLVGSTSEGDQPYLDSLKKEAAGYPIKFYPNISYDELVKLYGQSQIYWHAAGFGQSDPTKMEHFGITTVESMAGGCVPVVIKKGGQLEIVEEGKSGLFWESVEELENQTLELMGNQKKLKSFSEQAIKRSKRFSKEEFSEKICNLVYGNY